MVGTVQNIGNSIENNRTKRGQVSILRSKNSDLSDAVRLVSENLVASLRYMDAESKENHKLERAGCGKPTSHFKALFSHVMSSNLILCF